ncbi:MAG: sugar ABC transporter permease [Moraxellaceae bacterium]|nr:sugar ABC transporter permease [Moraxellaceae bacterium]
MPASTSLIAEDLASPTPQHSGAVARPAAASRRRLTMRKAAPYLFISPFFILFLVFGLFPLLFSIYVSFFQWDAATGLGGMEWVGIDNYAFVLMQDDWFHKSLYNTAWMGIAGGLPQHLVALPLAFFLHTAFGRWRNTFVGIYFLPFITSTVAISLVFTSLFSREFGVVNAMLGALLHLENIDWWQPQYSKTMISFVVWWRYVGFNTVLYLSAIQTIPRDLFEAAIMDGASRWQQFRHITLPMLKPMIYFAVTLTIIGSLQLFEEPFVLTAASAGDGRMSGSGGIDQAGKSAAMHVFTTGFGENDFGTASAVAWILFMIIALMTMLNNRLLGRDTEGR